MDSRFDRFMEKIFFPFIVFAGMAGLGLAVVTPPLILGGALAFDGYGFASQNNTLAGNVIAIEHVNSFFLCGSYIKVTVAVGGLDGGTGTTSSRIEEFELPNKDNLPGYEYLFRTKALAALPYDVKRMDPCKPAKKLN